MSEYLAFALIILTGIVQSFLQLGLGGLLLLYKNGFDKRDRRRARFLTNRYILGYAFFLILMISTTAFMISRNMQTLSAFTMTVVVLFLVVCALGMWTFYYKSRRSTELWLPRTVRRYINTRAKETNSRIEAFSLGMLSSFVEMPFSIMLYIVAGNTILFLDNKYQIMAVLLYVFISILPMLLTKRLIKSGRNIAEVQRWRLKNKPFLKLMGGIAFLTLAAFVFVFYCMGK